MSVVWDHPRGDSDTMTITEAAGRAGVNRSTLARAMRDGSVPVPLLKIGKCVRIPRAQFLRWISGEPALPGSGDDVSPPAASSPPSQ